MAMRFTYNEDDEHERKPVITLSPIQLAEKRQWQYATHDPVACAALAEALGASCRRGRPISYAALARGIVFRLPSINGGNPYVIDIQHSNRIDLHDQKMLDDFLSFLSLQSVKAASILASANVIDPAYPDRAPAGFPETARLLGYSQFGNSLMANGRHDRAVQVRNFDLWGIELMKVYAWFKAHPIHS